jgi:hypoxanthine phosphoribosyltransferase
MNQPIIYDNVVEIPEDGLVLPDGTREVISANIRDRISHVLIPEGCIKERVRAMGRRICEDYAKSKELNLVVILKGAFVFAADLGREIYRHNGPEVKYHFIRSQTYGKQIKQSGEAKREVKIESIPDSIKAKDVLLLDDILDQGFTLSKARQCVTEQDVGSLRVCCLLTKRLKEPSEEAKRLRNGLVLDYVGFEIPDKWVAGYGIDAGEDFRHLPFIVAVRENYYLNESQ